MTDSATFVRGRPRTRRFLTVWIVAAAIMILPTLALMAIAALTNVRFPIIWGHPAGPPCECEAIADVVNRVDFDGDGTRSYFDYGVDLLDRHPGAPGWVGVRDYDVPAEMFDSLVAKLRASDLVEVAYDRTSGGIYAEFVGSDHLWGISVEKGDGERDLVIAVAAKPPDEVGAQRVAELGETFPLLPEPRVPDRPRPWNRRLAAWLDGLETFELAGLIFLTGIVVVPTLVASLSIPFPVKAGRRDRFRPHGGT